MQGPEFEDQDCECGDMACTHPAHRKPTGSPREDKTMDETYDPSELFQCDECGTAWTTEAQAWECSHGDRLDEVDRTT